MIDAEIELLKLILSLASADSKACSPLGPSVHKRVTSLLSKSLASLGSLLTVGIPQIQPHRLSFSKGDPSFSPSHR